jgi:hypothetical protein
MKKIFSMIMFWLGILYIFICSWLVMWWVAPVWQNTPIEQFKGTAWAFEGPIYMTIGLSLPLGIILAGIGVLLYTNEKKRKWQLPVLIIAVIISAASIMFPATLNYYPIVFGILGLFILIFFVLSFWWWMKMRKALDGMRGTAADLRLLSYIFFYLAANFSCTLLGNPISGLFFPEKVIQYNSLPVYHAMGLKQALYFALGFVFIFCSNYIDNKFKDT